MTYRETVDWMMSQLPMYQRKGSVAFKKTLDNIVELCTAMGHPQHDFKSVHIAGTNGKGTTTHLIAAGLQANGLKVGVYTSPHYKDYRERIKINGELIPEEAVVSFVDRYKALFETVRPSFFEMTVALAFRYFADEAVDIAIVEVGLGGRLDSTNVLTPDLAVITNISFDHMAMLGNTLPLIAAEKAGIIKMNRPVIIGEKQKAVTKVFEDKAALLNAPLSYASDRVVLQSRSDGKYDVVVDGKSYLKGLACDLRGPFVHRNLTTALAALHDLDSKLDLDRRRIKQGIKVTSSLTYYIGRWQVLGEQPLTIAESAHNDAGVKDAIAGLADYDYDRVHFVLGFVSDKDVEGVLSHFPTDNAAYYWAKADIPRGMPAAALQARALKAGLIGEMYPSVSDAYAAAQADASARDLIYIGGSIFVVAEVL
jgi:dihydrofolate synthase/folylpolyglutamate synthase